jgi:hypothetical protein
MYKVWAIKSSPCTVTFNDLLCFYITNGNCNERSGVLMALTTEITFFSDVALGSQVEDYQCFGGKCCLHHQDRRIQSITSQKTVIFIVSSTGSSISHNNPPWGGYCTQSKQIQKPSNQERQASFCPEDRCSMFLQNISTLLPASHAIMQYFRLITFILNIEYNDKYMEEAVNNFLAYKLISFKLGKPYRSAGSKAKWRMLCSWICHISATLTISNQFI